MARFALPQPRRSRPQLAAVRSSVLRPSIRLYSKLLGQTKASSSTCGTHYLLPPYAMREGARERFAPGGRHRPMPRSVQPCRPAVCQSDDLGTARQAARCPGGLPLRRRGPERQHRGRDGTRTGLRRSAGFQGCAPGELGYRGGDGLGPSLAGCDASPVRSEGATLDCDGPTFGATLEALFTDLPERLQHHPFLSPDDRLPEAVYDFLL